MTSTEENTGPVWRQLLRLRCTAPAVFWTVIVLLSAEFLVVFVAPLIVPEYIYLSLYLNEEARQSTKRFLDGRDIFLLRDEVVGWRNRPNTSRGNWQIDAHGGRHTHPITKEPGRQRRVLFLGSSLINGGVEISNDETISACLEDSLTESLNFGTMMYSLDQSYLAYTHRLHEYNAKVIVIGLSGNAYGRLSNQYIPFRTKSEVYMPYVKPRFIIRSDTLELVPIPAKRIHRELFDNSNFLEYLKHTDEYYAEFAAYQRFVFLPLSSTVWYRYKRFRNMLRLVRGNEDELPLLKSLMNRMVAATRDNDASIIFLFLPDRTTTRPTGWRALLPDHYGKLIARLQTAGFPILDAREVFRHSGLPVSDLYYIDDRHFSATGNRLIAAALRKAIHRLEREYSQSQPFQD